MARVVVLSAEQSWMLAAMSRALSVRSSAQAMWLTCNNLQKGGWR